MKPTLLTLTFILLMGHALAADEPARKPHPLAPSLPQLTPAEEERIDRIIKRFIQADLGRLGGPEGAQAKADFEKLGPDAFFALVRGLNEAAGIEGSCPMVTIARKIQRILKASHDPALLVFARENVGIGVERSPHMGVIRDLRMVALMRQRDVAKGGAAAAPGDRDEGKIVIRPRQPGATGLGAKSTLELAQMARGAKGDKLKDILNELEKRSGETALSALAAAAGANQESKIRYLALELLVKNLSRQPETFLKTKLTDKRAEVRTAACWVVANKRLAFGHELIDLLSDKDLDVIQAARQALTRLTDDDTTDFGPNRNATDAEHTEAIRQWRSWWAKKSGE